MKGYLYVVIAMVMALIGKFNPDVEKYLFSENKLNFLSPLIQNEVVRDLAHTFLL